MQASRDIEYPTLPDPKVVQAQGKRVAGSAIGFDCEGYQETYEFENRFFIVIWTPQTGLYIIPARQLKTPTTIQRIQTWLRRMLA